MLSCISLSNKFGRRQYKYWIYKNCTCIANICLRAYVIMYVVDVVSDVPVLCRIICLAVFLFVCIVTNTSVHSSVIESSNWLACPPDQMFCKCY